MAGIVIGTIIFVLLLGAPLFMALYPGICALTMRRPRLGAVLSVAGLIATFGIPTAISRARSASGVFRDDFMFFVDYWTYGGAWALVGIVIVAFVGRRSKPVPEVNADPPGAVPPWIADMRRTDRS